MTFIATVQLALNQFYRYYSSDPKWIFLLDDFLISFHEEIEKLSKFISRVFLLILPIAFYVTIKKPQWALVSKFVRMEGLLGKLNLFLVIVTTFTLFSPNLDKSVIHAYQRCYKVAYREKLTQERKALLASAIDKEIEENADSLIVFRPPNVEALRLYFEQRDYEKADIPNETKDEACEAICGIGNDGNEDSDNGENSDFILDKKWKDEISILDSTDVNHSRLRGIVLTMRRVADSSTLIADEAVEGVKAAVAKVIGSLAPEDKGLIGEYIAEFLSASSEYLFDKLNVKKIVENVFYKKRAFEGIDIFQRIGNYFRGGALVTDIEMRPIDEPPNDDQLPPGDPSDQHDKLMAAVKNKVQSLPIEGLEYSTATVAEVRKKFIDDLKLENMSVGQLQAKLDELSEHGVVIQVRRITVPL